MKKTLIFLAFAIPALAMATGTPPASPEYSIDLGAGAQAGAVSDATATGTGTGIGTGTGTGTGIGTGGAGGVGKGGDAKAGSYSAGGQNALNNNSKTGVYVLPPPVWTVVPAASGCITTSSRALSVGWSLISASKSDQASDPVCVGIIMAKAAYDHCHFASEQMIMARVYESVFPNKPALPMVPDARNHTLAECEDMKRPRLMLTGGLTPPPAPPAAPAAPEPVRAPKPDRQ